MLNAITKFIGPKVGMAGLTVRNRAPEIYLVAGIAAGVSSVVMTAKAHKKSDEVFENIGATIAVLEGIIEENNKDNVIQSA